MGTRVVLDDELVECARQLTGIATKREAVEAALRAFIRLQAQGEIRQLRGKLTWKGDLAEQRQHRGGADYHERQ